MTQGSDTNDILIREVRRPRDDTAAARLRRDLDKALRHSLRLLRHAVLLAPIIITAILLLDLPLRAYDPLLAVSDRIKPSNWLSWGEALLVMSFPLLIGIVRCHGADFAGRVATIAWLLSAVLMTALLFYLAPTLGDGDLPGGRFMIGFFLSWYFGQLVAVHVYDITRGGKWWRAPFYGLVFGFGVQVAIYFPVVYSNSDQIHNVPWINWAILDFAIKVILALVFLPVYRALRRSLRPHLGLGGY